MSTVSASHVRRMRAIGLALWTLTAIGLLIWIGGCNSEVTGGKAKHDTGTITATAPTTQQSDKDFTLEVPTPYGTLVYRNGDRALISRGSDTTNDYDTTNTEQASGKTNTGQNLNIGSAKEGMLGSFSFVAAQIPYRNAWMLALGFFAAGALFIWVFDQLWIGIIFFGLGLCTFLNPGLMVWVGIIAGLGAVYMLYRKKENEKQAIIGQSTAEKNDLKQKFDEVVAGTKRALSKLPPELKERAKVEMEAEQDKPTKVAVAVSKAKNS